MYKSRIKWLLMLVQKVIILVPVMAISVTLWQKRRYSGRVVTLELSLENSNLVNILFLFWIFGAMSNMLRGLFLQVFSEPHNASKLI